MDDIDKMVKEFVKSALNVKQAAIILGVSTRTIQDWIKKGEFPHAYKLNTHKKNSPYRIPPADIHKFNAKRIG